MKQTYTKKIVLGTLFCSLVATVSAEDQAIQQTEASFKPFANTDNQAAPQTTNAFVNMDNQASSQNTTPFQPFQPFGHAFPSKPSIYGGLGIGAARLGSDCSGGNACKKDDTSWKVYGGYRINNQLAVQASYIDLGEFGSGNNKANIRGISASVLSPIAINEQLSIFGKAGFFKWETKTAQGDKVTDIDPTFGFGVDYRFNENIAIRGELDHYKDLGLAKDNAANFQVLSVGVNYSTL
jgi:OOP family OmpA-OmpF porin